jgi:SAM-dependent methyltransferase
MTGNPAFRLPEQYDRLIGRYSGELAHLLSEVAGVRAGQRVLDVGCGPGALTRRLAEIVGPENVSAVDPSEPFLEACRSRVPGIDARVSPAESLPFDDASFDVALAQLVVNFMSDAVKGVGEMRRVTKRGGTVAACVWDYGGGMEMLRAFWDAAKATAAPGAPPPDEAQTMRLRDPVSLRALWRRVGLDDVDVQPLVVSSEYDDFDDLWSPLAAGVGPSGAYAASLDERGQTALRDDLFARLGSPSGPFRLKALAWCATGTVPKRLPLTVEPPSPR